MNLEIFALTRVLSDFFSEMGRNVMRKKHIEFQVCSLHVDDDPHSFGRICENMCQKCVFSLHKRAYSVLSRAESKTN